MTPITLILNILWIVFGGLIMAVGWFIAGLIMAISIIGIPWAGAAFRIGLYALLPFGQAMVSQPPGLANGPAGTLGNIIWLILAGWWLALGHLTAAVAMALTIIGLPFAWAHLKLAGATLWPIGREIMSRDVALARGLV